MEKRLKELKDLYAQYEAEMRGIFDAAEKEKRSRTPEEKTKFDELEAKRSALETEITDMQEVIKRAAASARPVDFATPGRSDFGKDEVKNVRKFEFNKAIRGINPTSNIKLEGVEKELDQVAREEFKGNGIAPIDGAVNVPYSAMRQLSWTDEQRKAEYRDITTGAGLGAELINTATLSDRYIEALRPQNVLMNAGIEVIPNLDGSNQNWPRESSLYTAAMASTENASATESMTSSLFTTVAFTPKRGTGFVQLSNQVGAVQAPWIEARLRTQIAKGNATLMDTQGISGSGSSGQVTGILNTSSTGTVVGGTNGANFARTHITQFESVLGSAGGNLQNAAYITNFSVNAYGKRTEFSSGSGRYLVEGTPMWAWANDPTGKGAVSQIDQYRAFLSANVPNNLTKGTSTTVCSAVIFMDVAQAKYMQFGGLQIIVDPYSQGQSGLTNYYVHFWFDFKVILPGAVVISQDLLTP